LKKGKAYRTEEFSRDAIIDEPPHATENIEGVITRIGLDHHPFAPRILIEENPTTEDIAPETDGRKVYFSIPESSVIEQEVEGHSTIRIGLEDLEAGSRARGWHTGIIEDSYPQRAGAAQGHGCPTYVGSSEDGKRRSPGLTWWSPPAPAIFSDAGSLVPSMGMHPSGE
jgi:hypothetical protein